MKILCITPWYPLNREDITGSYIVDSIEALIAEGCQVVVLVSRPWRPRWAAWFSRDWVEKKRDKHLFEYPVYECHYFSIPRYILSRFSQWSYQKRVIPLAKKLMIKHQCQLIHAHTEWAALASTHLGSELKVPTVMTLHGLDTKMASATKLVKKYLYKKNLERSDRVIFVGQSLLNFFNSWIKSTSHFRVVPNGFRACEENRGFLKKSWNDDCLNFISVSNLHEAKGIDINLKALWLLNKMNRYQWNYTIIGEGCERQKLESLVRELALDKQVRFLGACSQSEVFAHLVQADIFVLPSYCEAFGVAYLEAMSCGLLAIGVQGQGPEAYIKHDQTGILIPPQNSEILFQYLAALFDSPEKFQQMANEGRNFVLNNFSWKHHARALMNVYYEVVID